MTNKRLLAFTLLIVLLQIGLGVALFRERVVSRGHAPDAVVFLAPLAIAATLQVLTRRNLRGNLYKTHDRIQLVSFLESAGITAIAFYITFLCDVNLFGS